MSGPVLPPEEFLLVRHRHVLRSGEWPGEEDHYVWWEPSEFGDPAAGEWADGGLLCGSSAGAADVASAAPDGKLVYVGPVAELPGGDGEASVELSARILLGRMP